MRSLVNAIAPQVMSAFDHLHSHPEISWREQETTQYIAAKLEKAGCSVRLFEDVTGVVGEFGEDDGGPIIGLRADLDALWQEVDGAFRANHSCGHDAHMSMALGALWTLAKMEDRPPGRIRLIFQPAEERSTGALKMIEKGALDRVSHLFSVHLRPLQELPSGKAAPAILHGAGAFIEGEIQGHDAHGARPHQNTNAIQIAADLVHHLNGVHLNPKIPHSVKVTRLHAGGDSPNVIPGRARFSLDLRAQTNEMMDALIDKVKSILHSLSDLYNVEIQNELTGRTAAAIPNAEATAIMAQAIQDTLGSENLAEPTITPGGEDFHYFPLREPNLKATMLGLGCNLKPGLHHPNMSFDHAAMLDGVEILSRCALIALRQTRS